MKKLTSLVAVLVAVAAVSSCAPKESEEAVPHKFHLIESTNIIGLWQQMDVNEVLDDEGNLAFRTQVPKTKYKCIMPNGNYFLMEVVRDEATGVQDTKILHYGTYTLQCDTMQIEHIESCFDVPELNGHDSYVRYNMPDENTITLYYKFGVETNTPGSSEWNQEVWRRVEMAK